MIEIREADDYFSCLIDHNRETGKYDVAEEVYDPYEKAGYQYQLYKVATGFNSIPEAENWMLQKRMEQEEREIDELYSQNDLVSPF